MVNFVFRWCIASSFIFHFLKCFTILFIHFIGTFNLFQNYHFLPEYSMSEFLFSPPLWTKYNSVSFSLLPSASLVSCIFRNYFYSCRTSSCHYPKPPKWWLRTHLSFCLTHSSKSPFTDVLLKLVCSNTVS